MLFIKNKNRGLFGTSIDSNIDIAIIPVPWEATISPPSGTSKTPEDILKTSANINIDYNEYPFLKNMSIYMPPIPTEWARLSNQLQSVVTGYIASSNENSKSIYSQNSAALQRINDYCYELKENIKKKAISFLNQNILTGLVGGDHSCALGLMQAMCEKYSSFGILQIDAQPNLKKNYQSFTYSHASVMYNALEYCQINKIIQLGIRDTSEEEYEVIKKNQDKIVTYYDYDIKKDRFKGRTWDNFTDEIIEKLPENIYITFDIDGLDSKLCPGTALPVPGGFQYEEILYLLKKIVDSKKKIIGFDLCEVATSEHIGWDISVANRLLLHLCALSIKSNIKE